MGEKAAKWHRRGTVDEDVNKRCKEMNELQHSKRDYYLAQALTACGSFRSYDKRFHKDNDDTCIYYGAIESTKHVPMFECGRWNEHM